MSTGQMLKELQGEKSQSTVAAAIGISKSAWAMYERDARVPRDEIKVKIAVFFGKTVQELFLVKMSTYSVRFAGGS